MRCGLDDDSAFEEPPYYRRVYAKSPDDVDAGGSVRRFEGVLHGHHFENPKELRGQVFLHAMVDNVIYGAEREIWDAMYDALEASEMVGEGTRRTGGARR